VDPVQPVEGEIVCGAQAARCFCDLPPHAVDVAHVCSCGGSWLGDAEGDDFQPVRFPPIFGLS
jgi:hypothetical protein